MIMLAQLFLNTEKIYYYQKADLWLTTQDVIATIKSMLRFVIKTIEKLLDAIVRKQPPYKRLLRKTIYLRI